MEALIESASSHLANISSPPTLDGDEALIQAMLQDQENQQKHDGTPCLSYFQILLTER
jgi:hypothetical protein